MVETYGYMTKWYVILSDIACVVKDHSLCVVHARNTDWIINLPDEGRPCEYIIDLACLIGSAAHGALAFDFQRYIVEVGVLSEPVRLDISDVRCDEG